MADDRRRGSYGQPSAQFNNSYDRGQGRTSNGDKRRSFSERAGQLLSEDYNDLDEQDHRPVKQPQSSSAIGQGARQDIRRVREPQAALHVPKPRHHVPGYSSDEAQDSRRNEQRNAGRLDDGSGATGVRRKEVRPRIDIPTAEGRQHRKAQQGTDSAGPQRVNSRRSSVPDRSPLQQLEGKFGDMSKGDKRARMEEAEYRAQQRGGNRNASAQESNANVPGRSGSDRRHVSAPTANSKEPYRAIDNVQAPRNSAAPRSDGQYHGRDPENGQTKFHRASEALRSQPDDQPSQNTSARRPVQDPTSRTAGPSQADPQSQQRRDQPAAGQVARSDSQKYKHRSRDAGYSGAAAAVAAASAAAHDGRDQREGKRGSADYSQPNRGDSQRSTRQRRNEVSENRRSADFAASAGGLEHSNNQAGRQSMEGADQEEPNVKRSSSKKLQRRNAPDEYRQGSRDPDRIPPSQHQLQTHRAGVNKEKEAAAKIQAPDPLPRDEVRNPREGGPYYQVPPQTAAGQDARDQLAFDSSQQTNRRDSGVNQQDRHRHLGGLFHRHHDQPTPQAQATPPIDEWRHAETARLGLNDMVRDHVITDATTDDQAWWERNQAKRNSQDGQKDMGASYDGAFEEKATSFRPPLYLKCGPLLRYTGMRRERRSSSQSGAVHDREIWRGSVMIVTDDRQSSYERPPTLRLFAQPMELLPPPPTKLDRELPAEQIDPLAGQIKLSRTGEPLYVKPADSLQESKDLSRIENDRGIFERTKSPTLGSHQLTGPDGQQNSHITITQKSRIRAKDGEKAGKYKEVKGARLHVERGFTFWRFNLEIELGTSQARVAYRINKGPAMGFWVPGRAQAMNIMFHSCNGFSMSVDPDQFSGPDPLWRDVMNMHQMRPFHVMLGGGDQVYNDAVMRDTTLFKEWLETKNPEHKHSADFSPEMQDELEDFYLNRYAMWFSQGLFGMANSQIPMVNIWDDHDIIDGFGSYPHHFMSSKVFTGLGAVAFKYYMLFQHQSVVSESYRDEPSWLLGASPGPYINEYSRSIFMFMGRRVAFLGLDCRTERMRDEILSQRSYDLIFNRCRAEIIKGETKHLIVLLGVPIAYPRLNFLENILTSRVMDPIKAIGRTGLLGGFVNKFDGGVEILDDLDDHWTAKHHKQERNWFIQELQELAAEKSVRVTILGGDVHLGAVGQFYTPKKFGVPKDQDHRYMPNIVSSAIVNTPPPPFMGDVLNKRNKVHHLDSETDEDMIPMFDYDVDGKPRNNHHLLPRRNYCTIREYMPGDTPPPTPPPEESRPNSNRGSRPGSSGSQKQSSTQQDDRRQDDRRFPPGSMGRPQPMGRSRSLTRDSFRPRNLIRRLSGSRSREQQPLSPDQISAYEDAEPVQDNFRIGDRNRRASSGDTGYFPQQQRPTTSTSSNAASSPTRPVHLFHRRPTDMSEKAASRAAAKGGPEGNLEGRDPDHLDLEYGLDVSLNMEIDQHDPAGGTVAYRLLVPALWYEGPSDENTSRFKTRRASIMDRLRGRGGGGRRRSIEESEPYSDEEADGRSHSPPNISRGDLSKGSRYPAMETAGVGAAGAAGAAAGQHTQDRHQQNQRDQEQLQQQQQQPARSQPQRNRSQQNARFENQQQGTRNDPSSAQRQRDLPAQRDQAQSYDGTSDGIHTQQTRKSHGMGNLNNDAGPTYHATATGPTSTNNAHMTDNTNDNARAASPPLAANATAPLPAEPTRRQSFQDRLLGSFRRKARANFEKRHDEGYGRERYGDDSAGEDEDGEPYSDGQEGGEYSDEEAGYDGARDRKRGSGGGGGGGGNGGGGGWRARFGGRPLSNEYRNNVPLNASHSGRYTGRDGNGRAAAATAAAPGLANRAERGAGGVSRNPDRPPIGDNRNEDYGDEGSLSEGSYFTDDEEGGDHEPQRAAGVARQEGTARQGGDQNDSLDEAEFNTSSGGPGERRMSKAERFFGVGDERVPGGAGQSVGQNARPVPVKGAGGRVPDNAAVVKKDRRGSWRIWKADWMLADLKDRY